MLIDSLYCINIDNIPLNQIYKNKIKINNSAHILIVNNYYCYKQMKYIGLYALVGRQINNKEYCLIGGKIESNETVYETIKREIKEEIKIDINIDKTTPWIYCHGSLVFIYYVNGLSTKIINSLIKNEERDEIDIVDWMLIDNKIKLMYSEENNYIISKFARTARNVYRKYILKI